MISEPIAKKNGCSVVRNYTAHGVNQLFHGSPTNIPHYAKNKAIGTMKPGMVSCFSIISDETITSFDTLFALLSSEDLHY